MSNKHSFLAMLFAGVMTLNGYPNTIFPYD